MSICIIGGTGFLGKHICERFHKYEISATIISRQPNYDFLESLNPKLRGVPLNSDESWEVLADAKFIIYLGSASLPGSHWNAPHYDMQNNLLPLTSFLEKLYQVNHSAHIIYASSGGQVYGDGLNSHIPETQQPAPTTAYALGKILAEETLRFFSRSYGNQLTILRIANPVGRWQLEKNHGFISAAIKAHLSNTELTIYGNGQNMRDYFDVDELAELISGFIKKPPISGIFNIGSGKGFTEIEILRELTNLTGMETKFKMVAGRPFDLKYAILDSTKAKLFLGWSPKSTLPDILNKMVVSYSEYENFLR